MITKINVKDIGEDRYYFLILKDEGATVSDVHRFDEVEILKVKQMCVDYLNGLETSNTLHKSENFVRFVKTKDGQYLLSFAVSETFFKGYYFSFRGIKSLISAIDKSIRN